MKEDTMGALLERAKAGDQGAFTALYNATNQEVYQTIRSMVRDEHLALDIQQEVYVRAFTHLNQLGDPEKFPTWLRAIAVNQTRSVMRKQTPILFTELEQDDSEVPEVPDIRPESCPEARMEQKETSRLVQEILGSLTDSQRLIVGMYYYEQIPITKIADDLGVSPGTVKTQLSRSRKKVEAQVRELEDQGIKLYGLSPMPFLLMLLKRLKPGAKAGEKVLTGALSESGLAETAAIHASTGFFHTIAGRAAIAVAAVAVIGGGIAGYRWYQNRGAAAILGDVQLMETVYMADIHDTPEDLVIDSETEESAFLETEADTPEDLIVVTTEATDPETSEPETTEQEPTEPEPASPAPTQPPAPTPTNPTPPQPTDPQPTEPAPTEPAPTDPDPTVPSDPQTSESQPTDPTEPETPEPSESETPEPSESETPEPSESETPEPQPSDPVDPEPTDPEQTETEPTDPEEPASAEETEDGSMLPTTPPYPPKPGNITIALGETWTYHYEGEIPVRLKFYAVNKYGRSGARDILIGVQENGITDLSFHPTEAGYYVIVYVVENGNRIEWATVKVTEG